MTKPLAVVTGAASGIGLALSTERSRRDVDVIAIDKVPCSFPSVPGIKHAFVHEGQPRVSCGDMP